MTEVEELYHKIRTELMADINVKPMPHYTNGISDAVMLGLLAYVYRGQIPGHFLTCLLQNDLFGTVGRADNNSYANLRELIHFVYNYLPGLCYGSPEKVKDWSESRHAAMQSKDAAAGLAGSQA